MNQIRVKKYASILGVLGLFSVLLTAGSLADTGLPDEFKMAIQARAEGRNYAALEILSDIGKIYPDLKAVQLEKILNLVKIRKYQEALNLLDRLGQDRNLNPRFDEKVTRIEQKVRAIHEKNDQKKSQFKGNASLGIGHDSNAGVGLASIFFDDIFNDWALVHFGPKEGNYVKVLGQIQHHYKFDETLNFQGRPVFAGWKSELIGYARLYSSLEKSAVVIADPITDSSIPFSDFPLVSNNIVIGSFRTGPLFYVSDRWVSKLKFSVDHINFRKQAYANFFAAEYLHKLILGGGFEIGVHGKYQKRNYIQDFYQDRSGHRYGAGGKMSWEKGDFDITAGVSLYRFASKMEFYSYNLRNFEISLNYNWNKKIRTFGSVSFDKYTYSENDQDFSYKIIDKKDHYNFGASYEINEKWRVMANYYYSKSDSKNSIRRYSRNKIELSLNYKF